jgi:hypothetical protein
MVVPAAVVSAYVERPWDLLVPRWYSDVDLLAVGIAAVPFTVLAALLGSALGLALVIALQQGRRTAADGQPMRLMRVPAAALFTLVLMANPGGTAMAHDFGPLSSTDARVGPYRLEVRYYGEPVGGRELQFELIPSGATAAPTHCHAVAIPGPTTNAVPVSARLQEADHAGVIGAVNLPVSGRWLLSIDVDGPLGAASGEAPIVAAPPAAAMPDGLAWLIGTSPVSLALAFVAWRFFTRTRRFVASAAPS